MRHIRNSNFEISFILTFFFSKTPRSLHKQKSLLIQLTHSLAPIQITWVYRPLMLTASK